MHATIDVRFELSIDDDKTLPLATLAEAVTDQNLEAVLLESLVESLDAASVEALCGEKHAHGNGDQRFQRAGTDTRTAVTTAGEHEFSLHYVEDTAASPDESSYFRPVEDVLDFDGQNRYQQDIAAKSVDLATSLSYRDAANHGDSFVSMPSPTTINRHAKKYGHKLKQFLPDCVAGTDADAVIPDGTKCHSQDDDRSSHSVQATLGEDTAEESRSLLDLSVNADWDETAAELDDIGAVTDDATVVSDADSGIVTAFTDENRDHQLDLVHVGRTLGYTLWDDGVFSLDRRKEIVSEVIDEVFHLKNSVAKHRPAEEFAAIRSRIARTRERLEKTAWQLEQFGSAKAAGYLRRWLPSIVTFAEHAVEGFEVPWTSNPVERLMGEVSKRCKNQWMRWTAEGLEAILQLRLVKYADPEYYQAFLDELLQRSTKTAINCDLSIESTSGKV
ncbi:transposase (ISH6) [Halorubrum lacusprofundi ATCC 49239]|uniref:Transposase (ISH6) n=1 Tax=Halorubrum lacusprofundi (strain ATCC 49239 / DSM 5036 / JCM 8891 / ACAM 34) TaxID=416348 RepID=B9LRV3_HALLT|nr:ISH6-like element ISHla10 family transposase [Halorubrum lacusprofundi]ACM57827.1 transposase (ISH6) [Halorubrum lacusprofundi ATCC 49239]